MSLQNSTSRRQGEIESPTNTDPVTAGSTLIPAQVLTLTRRVKALVDKGLDQPAEEIVDEVDCRVSCAIAALGLAGRESGLSGKEVDEQRDNLVQVVRLLRSEAR